MQLKATGLLHDAQLIFVRIEIDFCACLRIVSLGMVFARRKYSSNTLLRGHP
jgi:hypothetical protein